MWPIYGTHSIVWGWRPRIASPDTSGATASKAQWTLIQGNRSYVVRWTGRRASDFPNTGSFAVAGSITARFVIPPPQGFLVAGRVAFSVARVAGAVALTGAFTCTGQVDALFTIPTPNSFRMAGNIHAIFYTRGGQLGSCIAGSGSPAAGSTPWNAVY